MNINRDIEADVAKAAKANGGELTPRKLLSWAKRHKSSAIHEAFEWNDDAAAEAYRLEQARRVIRLCVHVIEIPAGESKLDVKVRKYVSLSDERKEGGDTVYRETEKVVDNTAWRETMLADAFADLAALRRKYSALSELSQVWTALDAAMAEAV
jgi:hypothetical protein